MCPIALVRWYEFMRLSLIIPGLSRNQIRHNVTFP